MPGVGAAAGPDAASTKPQPESTALKPPAAPPQSDATSDNESADEDMVQDTKAKPRGRITFSQYNLLFALCASVFLSGCLSACVGARAFAPCLTRCGMNVP